jgi:hypothetical protein
MATKAKGWTPLDLHDAPKGAVLKCAGRCAGEFSATPGDYFLHPHDKLLVCCDVPMVVVTRKVVLQEVAAPTRQK